MATSLEGVTPSLEGIRGLSIERLKESVFDVTPYDQAIMLVGVHGVGKSEFIKTYFENKGYAIITLFLGQMADSGDLIGLPDRSEVVFTYEGKELHQKITEFCPPKWWPRDDSVRIVLFLDEFNRGKQEVYQCIMDLALRRQLNGLSLPKETRIIAAMNPLDEKYGYQVTELDPALWDRFNVYGFCPEAKEWIHWAINEKLHPSVIGFIIKNSIELDPPADGKIGAIYPSRRSWHRLSNILKENPSIVNEDKLVIVRELAEGIVGSAATSKFFQYIKNKNKGLNPGTIVTAWFNKVEDIVKAMDNQSKLAFNAELVIHLEENEELYFDASSSKQKEKYAYNVYQYLKSIPRECMADFYDYVGDAVTKYEKTWSTKLLESNISGLVNDFISIYHGDTSSVDDSPPDINDHNGNDGMFDGDIKDILGE